MPEEPVTGFSGCSSGCFSAVLTTVCGTAEMFSSAGIGRPGLLTTLDIFSSGGISADGWRTFGLSSALFGDEYSNFVLLRSGVRTVSFFDGIFKGEDAFSVFVITGPLWVMEGVSKKANRFLRSDVEIEKSGFVEYNRAFCGFAAGATNSEIFGGLSSFSNATEAYQIL